MTEQQPLDHSSRMEDILERQAKALESLQCHLIPEKTQARDRRWRIFIAKTVTIASLLGGIIVGSWELATVLYDRYLLRVMVDQYADVAEEVYYQENNSEVAKAFLGKALEIGGDDPRLRYLEAYIDGMAVMRNLLNLDRPYTQEELNDAHMAIAQAEMLERVAGEMKPEPHILKGQIYAALGDHKRAYERLERAGKLAPENDFVHVRLASLASEQGDQEKALQHVQKALDLNPESKWAWLWSGVVNGEKLGNWDEARTAYRKALEIDPRFDMAHYNMGWTYLKQVPHDYRNALECFEKVAALNPGNKLAFYGLGMTYGYQDQYEIAKMYLDKAVELDPMFLSGWKWRGIILYEMGNFEDALADFTTALELDPTRSDIYVRRAWVYQKQDKLNKAIEDLHFAARNTPEDEHVWYYLGSVFLKVREFSKALQYFDKAIELNAAYAEAYAARSDARYGSGDQSGALADMNMAVDVCSYRPEKFLFRRGVLLCRYSLEGEAVKNFRLAREAAPAYAEAWMEEARLLRKVGNRAEAMRAVDEYIRLRPQDRAGYALRKDIESL